MSPLVAAKRRRFSRRRAGRRRGFMPAMFGWLTTAAGGALTLFFVWQLVSPTIVPRDEGWKALLAAAATTVAISQYWFNVARRTRTAPVTLEPSEASVLYLRAFDEEQRPFAVGPRSVLKKYTSQLAANAPYTRGDPTIKLTLEDFFEEAITERLGAFVGLGNPHDRMHPDGALREYAPDELWQSRFLALAESAKCIVVSVGGSANLQWELEQIRQLGLTKKLCLFTSPRVPGSDEGIINTLRRSKARRGRELADAWAKSLEAMRRAGYECDAACPGAGAAMTFDEQGKSMVITADAETPAEFITPVADWFKAGQRTGRCIPVECPSCRGLTHVTPEGTVGTALCRACERGQLHAQMSLTERHPVIWSLVALGLTAIPVAAWGIESPWVLIPIWIAIVLSPFPIRAGWQRVRQRRSRGPRMDKGA